MSWFEALTGCREGSPEQVRQQLEVDGNRLRSAANNCEWQCGILNIPSLAELRERARQVARNNRVDPNEQPTSIREVVGDVQELHIDPANAGAMFQVASQFNLLEMTSPQRTPEEGIGIYEHDFTQGPACAIAAGAGTIYRNYFAPVNGQVGQTAETQIDCLADIGDRLGNEDQRYWQMKNGYALPSADGLAAINKQLSNMDRVGRDRLRALLRIGLQIDTQVTLKQASHCVSQAYCSAMPVAYTGLSSQQWAPFASLILEAAYEATICAAIENAARTGNRRVYLTLLGGGAFGNDTSWILNAIHRAVALYSDCGLDIAIVSHSQPNPQVWQLTEGLTSFIRK